MSSSSVGWNRNPGRVRSGDEFSSILSSRLMTRMILCSINTIYSEMVSCVNAIESPPKSLNSVNFQEYGGKEEVGRG